MGFHVSRYTQKWISLWLLVEHYNLESENEYFLLLQYSDTIRQLGACYS